MELILNKDKQNKCWMLDINHHSFNVTEAKNLSKIFFLIGHLKVLGFVNYLYLLDYFQS